MALITPADIRALHVSFSTIYREAFAGTQPWYSKVATEVPIGTATARFGFMGQQANLRQWVGPRVVNDLQAYSYSLDMLPWEFTISVDRHDWEDHNLGVYTPMFADMGRAAAKLADQRLTTIIQANGNGFDGVAMFAGTHPLNPAGVQDNNLALALTETNYEAARAAMMAFSGEDGSPLGIIPNVLAVPPQLEGTGRRILNASIVMDATGTAGISNVMAGSASLMVVPEWANQPTRWYLFDTSRAIKPFVWCLREAPKFVAKQSPDDDSVFWDREFVWGVEARGEAGFGPWFLAVRSTP